MQPTRFHTEKRHFKRLNMNCAASYQVLNNPNRKMGTCINLSAGGLLLECDDAYPVGTKINVSVSPNPMQPPTFTALMKVVRVAAVSESFQLGGVLESIT